MKQVLISVEGDTEAAFVTSLLSPHLQRRNIYVYNSSLDGIKPYNQVRREIKDFLRGSHLAAVTTMYDLYRLPRSFPGCDTLPAGDGYTRVSHMERAFEQDINDSRFKAYLQLHEFEALLFTDPGEIAACFPGSRVQDLRAIRDDFNSPEDINDRPGLSPSRRIKRLLPEYNKILDGNLIALEIGLPRMRAECHHFNEWVTWLESR